MAEPWGALQNRKNLDYNGDVTGEQSGEEGMGLFVFIGSGTHIYEVGSHVVNH